MKLYCGGTFPFDYQLPDYRERAKEDYRAKLLGNVDLLLEKHPFVELREGIRYLGPFYFEAEDMQAQAIVDAELQMIRQCSHAIFLLEAGNCPGTIAELTLASTLQKQVEIFYVQKTSTEETESDLHTPCWFAILASLSLNRNTHITACESYADAAHRILDFVYSAYLSNR